MNEHDQQCESHDNIQRNCYCQQRRERSYIEKLEAERDRYKETLEKMLSPEMDWENGEIGVGNSFRIVARQALEGKEK